MSFVLSKRIFNQQYCLTILLIDKVNLLLCHKWFLTNYQIRLHTENQLPKLSRSALKVCAGGGGGGWVPLNYVVTPTSYWVEAGLRQ